MSFEKSKIFFSENVNRDLAKLISDESGIKSTRDLGKYLGMPILHKRLNKDTFGDILEKVSSRLSGWKGRMLSFAGRLTLTKAVLSSIPVHAMSTISLPQSTLARLDQLSRSFLWGSTTEKRKQHLVAWDRVCKPKAEGGLGIRSSKAMNIALLAKIGWRILHDNTSLWACVLKTKYKVGDVHDMTWTAPRSNWSSTWRSVGIGLRSVVLPGVSWVIGDGRSVKFWRDKWITGTSLSDCVSVALLESSKDLCVRDLWAEGSGWVLPQIAPYVSQAVTLNLAAMVVDTVTGAKDRLSWSFSADGRFSVRSAYSFLTRDYSPAQQMDLFFSRVWKLKVPERVRVFIWLVVSQVVMTNSERRRRHLCDSAICQVCKSGEETILHVLRDCPAMSGIWTRIVPRNRRQAFFDQSLLEWLFGNLGDELRREDVPWCILFAMAVWWGWKWRCINVFGGTEICRDRVRFVKDMAKEVAQNKLQNESNLQFRPRVERLVGWTRPSEGWLKLNTDGASRGNPGLASAGGVL